MTLDDIIEAKKQQLQEEKMLVSEAQLREQVSESQRVPLSLQKALTQQYLVLIGPIIKASPVKKVSRHRFAVSEIARSEQKEGAGALMVCTEATFYEGQQQYVDEIRAYTQVPILLYDYIVEPYQLYAAASIGADAVVLMSAILNLDAMARFMRILQELGLEAVVEAHTEQDVQAGLQSGAQMFLIKNYDLNGTGSLDVTRQLIPMIPDGSAAISWGGIANMKALEQVCSWGSSAACPAARMFADTPGDTLARQVRALGAPGRRI